eukprot:CAMPEP_0170383608 /NCGR_PEP_ID=MMETSP0117_2-20130122/15562_1 /TAXON_ID=400756 /ORGANISM="Durinskia baltica, Strain CSIRO CS-38" /LENGTH=439 /DNA_ID=CAMNT_0010639315 /DNA_START=41 /DNA_END=1360 /DNA_ORIENTATION=+
MSAEAKEDVEMTVDAQEVEDEYVVSFEDLDSSADVKDKTSEFQKLLQNSRYDEKAVKVKEQCIYRLAKLYTEGKQFAEVMALLKSNNELFSLIPKAKTAKIVRNILNIVGSIPDSLEIQISLSRDVVQWCIAEKRTFLRQRIEAKLASLLQQQKQPSAALEIVDKLLVELKKLDDKQMLTETHLTEARIYHSMQNIPKAKASLTASRSAANAIYVVPLLQAEIDETSGILHCEEGDYVTAYSYFLEAFEAYDQSNSKSSAVSCIQYMILCKVLNECAAEVPSILTSKLGMKHSGIQLEAMAEVARASKVRSLEDFQAAVSKYGVYLKTDDLIAHHLDLLYDKMLEANLLKIIHPYSSVEISHVAKLINLPEPQVVHKLSQMVLDKKFFGILDQGRGHLIVYETAEEDINFTKGVEVIGNMENVVEALFGRTKALVKTNA